MFLNFPCHHVLCPMVRFASNRAFSAEKKYRRKGCTGKSYVKFISSPTDQNLKTRYFPRRVKTPALPCHLFGKKKGVGHADMEISKPSCAAQTVFVVDDHPLIRDWLSRLINEEKDLKVCGWAETVDAATKAIEQLKPSIVIVDIALHGKSGLELIRLLTERNSPAPILVLSMHDEAIFAQRALKAGARGYVSKRETTERVVQAIRRILEGGMYISDALAETLAAGLCDGKRKAHWSNNVSRLSDRELEVFRLLAAGRRTSEIAQDLTLSLKSIQTFCARIKTKLNLRDHSELLQVSTRWFDAQNNA